MYTKTDEFPENFRKGGGVISDLKNFIAIFFALGKAFLVINFRKKLRKGGGRHFRSEKLHCKFSAGATGLRKKSQYCFPKKGRGGSGAVRKFSGNSSVFVCTGFPNLGTWIISDTGRKR